MSALKDADAHRAQNLPVATGGPPKITYSQLAGLDADPAAPPSASVPQQPASSPWASDPVPPERPLGIDIEMVSGCGDKVGDA
jgi:hypothetical protein